jgi:SAM-dependent methyltransferase
MSALALDFPDASFGAVHAAQLIEHFAPSDAARFISEAARVLRPGGYLFMTTPGVRNVWGTFSHIRPYPPAAFAKLLTCAVENYIRDTTPPLDFEYAQGCRHYSTSRAVTFASSIFDLLFPPRDPIGWTIILRRK